MLFSLAAVSPGPKVTPAPPGLSWPASTQLAHLRNRIRQNRIQPVTGKPLCIRYRVVLQCISCQAVWSTGEVVGVDALHNDVNTLSAMNETLQRHGHAGHSTWGFRRAGWAVGCDDFSVGQRDAAQAMKLVRALREQLDEMTAQLARVERQGVTARGSQASAMRLEAASLRRDINEAQLLIDRLQRRYLGGDERPQQRPHG